MDLYGILCCKQRQKQDMLVGMLLLLQQLTINSSHARKVCMLIYSKINCFSKNSYRNIRLNPDQARPLFGPDLGTNCLQRFSADSITKCDLF